MIAGRRGEQALSVEILDEPPSVLKARRKKHEQMAVIFEDLLKVMDHTGNTYKHGRYPSPQQAKKLATMLRAVADELEL